MNDPAPSLPLPLIQYVAESGSTNQDIRALYQEGKITDLAGLRAGQQLSGRGRGDHRWESPVGNLYLSLLSLDPPSAPIHQLGLIAGVALAQGLVTLLPELKPQLQLKWPNDLLLDQGKLAGILAEAQGKAGQQTATVIGFGVNVSVAPTIAGAKSLQQKKAVALNGVGVIWQDLDVFLQELAVSIQSRFASWRTIWRTQGFLPVKEAWEGWGPAVDSPISFEDGKYRGLYRGLAESGGLQLQTDQGLEVIFNSPA